MTKKTSQPNSHFRLLGASLIFVAILALSLILSLIALRSPRLPHIVCPQTSWINCMPGPQRPNPQCNPEFLAWAEVNCPGFEGAAY